MHQVDLFSSDLRREQLTELSLYLDVRPGLLKQRQRAYFKQGLYHLNKLRERALISPEAIDLFNSNLDLPENRIFHKIPVSVFFSVGRALAMEKTFFSGSSDDTVQLAMLMSIFTNLYDEIVDEAPNLLTAYDKQWMHEVMSKRGWVPGSPPTLPDTHQSHPAVRILLEVISSIISLVTSQIVWKSDSVVRAEFETASAAAFFAENDSVEVPDLDQIPANIQALGEKLQSKSVNWAWAVSLAPFCIHGWPPHVAPEQLRLIVSRLGVFGGWLDDLSDIEKDYVSNKWSNVFVELYKLLSFLPVASTDFPAVIRNCLADEAVVRHLVRIGSTYYSDLINALKAVNSNTEPFKEITHDTILMFLSPDCFSNAYQEAPVHENNL